MKQAKIIFYNLTLLFFTILASLSLLDFALHFTNYVSLIKKAVYPRFYFVKDREIGFDIAKNVAKEKHTFFDFSYDIWSNSLGCFDEEYKRGGGAYMYLAGDSFTWGFSPFEDKWGTKLESFLGIRVLKCGVGGHGTKQEFIKTSRTLKNLPKPRLIIVGYTQGNDIDDDANFPNGSVYNGYSVRNLAKNGMSEAEAEKKYALFDRYCTIEEPANPKFQVIKCWFNDHSILYNVLKNNIREVMVRFLPNGLLKKSGLVVEEKKQERVLIDETEYRKHLDNIKAFKQLADSYGSSLLFVLVPGDNEKLKPFLDENKISYLDLKPIFEKYSKIKPLRWRVDGHWNIAGNHVAGFAVSKYIIENDLMKVGDKTERINMIDAEMKKEFGGLD